MSQYEFERTAEVNTAVALLGAMLAFAVLLMPRGDKRRRARALGAAACVLLDALPEGESSVLHAYYVKRLKMPAIAKRMGYTEGYIRKLKKEGENLMDALPADTVAACLPAWYIRERPEPPNT